MPLPPSRKASPITIVAHAAKGVNIGSLLPFSCTQATATDPNYGWHCRRRAPAIICAATIPRVHLLLCLPAPILQ